MPPPVAESLNALHLTSGVGVPETSGYPALHEQLDTPYTPCAATPFFNLA